MAPSHEKTSSSLDPKSIAEAIMAGNRQMLARAITLVESAKEEHQEKAHAVLDICLAKQRESMVIGITGSPGAGKSSFIEALGAEIIQKGLTLAVLCIDPSSRRSGGSILGDKARMEKLSTRPEAFIRPTPRRVIWEEAAREPMKQLCSPGRQDTMSFLLKQSG